MLILKSHIEISLTRCFCLCVVQVFQDYADGRMPLMPETLLSFQVIGAAKSGHPEPQLSALQVVA